MKNNKGFTLVELLAVVVILITLITIITPKVFKQLKNSETVIDREQINAIIDTSKLYMNQHSELLPKENSLYVITLNELKDSGLIKSNQILNPSTNEELKGCVLVKYQNNKYNYEYNEDKCDKIVTLTFNPNGGQLNQTTKNVIKGEPYGEMPTPTREGYTFMGWSTSSTDTNIIYDNNEYSGTLAADSESPSKNIKDYTISGPFQENDIYQIDVDLKGEGQVTTYFHGNTNYLRVKSVRATYGEERQADGDGKIAINLSNEYKHITLGYILGNTGDGSVDKKLLFRIYRGNTVYFKNVRITKVSNSSIIYPANVKEDLSGINTYPNARSFYDNNEYYATYGSNEINYKDFRRYRIYAPFSENDVYQLDFDAKGQGTLRNYFYGDYGYLQVKKVETSDGHELNRSDGMNDITLTNDYKHYTVRFTLGNTGNGNTDKLLLFRLYPGNTAYIKNVKLQKIYPAEEEVVLENNKTLYAIWKANS